MADATADPPLSSGRTTKDASSPGERLIGTVELMLSVVMKWTAGRGLTELRCQFVSTNRRKLGSARFNLRPDMSSRRFCSQGSLSAAPLVRPVTVMSVAPGLSLMRGEGHPSAWRLLAQTMRQAGAALPPCTPPAPQVRRRVS